MHDALALHLVFLAVALGQAALHLAEAVIVQLRRIGVNAGDFPSRRGRQPHRLGERMVGVVGRIQGNQYSSQRNRPAARKLACRRNRRRLLLRRAGHRHDFLSRLFSAGLDRSGNDNSSLPRHLAHLVPAFRRNAHVA